jgi:uracil-DNA glycosylase family 4
MFTGDSSGDFLYGVLHREGFATQAASISRDDGLRLVDCYIGAAARCAPPDNKPAREELARCREYLENEIDLLHRVKVVVALGRIAFDTYLAIARDRGIIESRSGVRFGHGVEYSMGAGNPVLAGSYHPSQQNTSTGRLTEPMLRAVFHRARALIEMPGGVSLTH